MKTGKEEIVLVDSLDNHRVPEDFEQDYFTHNLCRRGRGQFRIGGKIQTISKNDIVILLPNEKIHDLNLEEGFEAFFLLVSFDLMSKNNPDIGWGIKAYLFSRENPVVSLGPKGANLCVHNFKLLQERYEETNHRFRKEIVNLQLKIFVMEMWNLFANEIEQQIKSNENKSLFQRFLQLVQIHCMEQREVEYYAGLLSITPKYLSEICKKSSGKNASEWIQNYTTTRLILLLRNQDLSFSEIAYSMNFSSLSFFSRYVKKVLGASPSDYRSSLGKNV